MKFLGLIPVFLIFTLALGAPHKRQAESPEYVLWLINSIREAHGVNTLLWNTDLERAGLTRAERCLEKIPYPPRVLSMFTKGSSSWKEMITKLYSLGLSKYDFSNPKLQSSDSIIMVLLAPRHKSVGCAAANCNGTSLHYCLFEHEVAYQSAEEFVNDIKANVRPANATLTIDSITPNSVLTNLSSPQFYNAYISF
ncbi:uncharacterized protein VTP21DRAFT_7757 [Calcarisporiella thermophila]|uniref:uncharacterized protein n=1 Tax=Calcarisporiella thermophila TaxID=911321 RepID=UPI0037426E01